jgi:hypothetical protein
VLPIVEELWRRVSEGSDGDCGGGNPNCMQVVAGLPSMNIEIYTSRSPCWLSKQTPSWAVANRMWEKGLAPEKCPRLSLSLDEDPIILKDGQALWLQQFTHV